MLDYWEHMEASGHDVRGRHIKVPGESRPFRVDLRVVDLSLIVEAKGTMDRNAIRLAIGQVFDYRRYEKPRPQHVGVLLPRRPELDVLDLFDDVGVIGIWQHSDGFADTKRGLFSR